MMMMSAHDDVSTYIKYILHRKEGSLVWGANTVMPPVYPPLHATTDVPKFCMDGIRSSR
jgi:hypothetical protein